MTDMDGYLAPIYDLRTGRRVDPQAISACPAMHRLDDLAQARQLHPSNRSLSNSQERADG